MVKTKKKLDGNYYPSEDGEPQHAESEDSNQEPQEAQKKAKKGIKNEKAKLRNREYRRRIRDKVADPAVI